MIPLKSQARCLHTKYINVLTESPPPPQLKSHNLTLFLTLIILTNTRFLPYQLKTYINQLATYIFIPTL